MQLNVEITQKKDLRIPKKNGYYLIKQEKGRFYIYVKYDGDNQLYYIESMETIGDALLSVYVGYIETI